MAGFFTNGFEHRFPRARSFGFDDVVDPESHMAYVDESGRTTLTIITGGATPFRKGGVIHCGDLTNVWFGAALRTTSIVAGRWPCRVLLIEVDGNRVAQVVWNNMTTTEGHVPARSFAIFAGGGDSDELTLDAGDLLASGPTNMVGDGTIRFTFQVRIQRGESGGSVTVVSGGETISASVPGLTDANDLDLVATGRNMSTSTSGTHDVRWTDVWASDGVNYGGATIVTMWPDTQGFHDDGTVTGAASALDALDNAPPQEGQFVDFGDGDRQSFDYAGDFSVAQGVAIGAVVFRGLAESELPFGFFVRSDSTDTEIGTIEGKGDAVLPYVAAFPTDPREASLWSKADLEAGIELGVSFDV
jgi:hypothetical protein